ncbi:hypothetical protein JCM6882_000331 [Rhodosporidiobolus microsporus]
MFFSRLLFRAGWEAGIGGRHHFSIAQSMRVARKDGLCVSNLFVILVAQIVSSWVGCREISRRSRLVAATFPSLMMALPLPAMLLESRVPGIVKEYLDARLPEQAQVVTHALFVAGPSIFLSGFFPARSVLRIACEVVMWLIMLPVSLVLAAVETALYASTLLLLASVWAFVYRDVARYLLLRNSSKYRSTICASEILDVVGTSFSLDNRFLAFEAQIDALLPARGRYMAHDFFPFEALEIFDLANAPLWPQDAAYFASLSDLASHDEAIAAEVATGFRELAKFLEARHKAEPRRKALTSLVGVAIFIARRCNLDSDQRTRLLPLLIETEQTRARAEKSAVAAHRAILDAVLDWKNRKNALEIQRLKQD